MSPWDRSTFSTSVEELEVEEVIRGLQRILTSPLLKNSTRVSLKLSLDVLRADWGQQASHEAPLRGASDTGR